MVYGSDGNYVGSQIAFKNFDTVPCFQFVLNRGFMMDVSNKLYNKFMFIN